MNISLREQQMHTFVEHAQQGDKAAMSALISLTITTVNSIALAITHDLDTAHDVSQKVYIKIWQDINQLKQSHSFLPWVRQITRYMALNTLRDSHISRFTSQSETEQILEQLVCQKTTLDESLIKQQQNQVLSALLAELPAESREILVLFYREQQDSEAVAQLLGLNRATVRKRLERVRASIKTKMLKQYGEVLLATVPTSISGFLAMSTLASTPVAAATLTHSVTTSQSSWLIKLFMLLGGAIIGAMLAVSAHLLSMHWVLKKVTDDTLRLQLLALRNQTTIAIIVGALLMTVGYEYTEGWLVICVSFLIMFGVIARNALLVHKAVSTSPSLSAHSSFIGCLIGLSGGLLGGGGGLVIGLYQSGRFLSFF